MATFDISPSEWRSFFDSFSRMHAGWIVNLETRDRAGTQVDVRDRPLRGITVDLPRPDGAQGLSIVLDGPHQHFARVVPMPTRVVVDRTDAGADRAVIVEQQFGPETIVRFRSPMPTDMVDGVAPQEEPAPRGRPRDSIPLRAILVAIDFTSASSTALRYAATLARLVNARLHVLHIGPDVACGTDEDATHSEPDTAAAFDEIRRFIGEDAAGVAITVAHRRGTPVVGILDYARDHDIDLVVMGTHARGHVSHMDTGSIAQVVLREAPCPLLVVRDGEREVTGASSKGRGTVDDSADRVEAGMACTS